jgi:hypothetical protein
LILLKTVIERGIKVNENIQPSNVVSGVKLIHILHFKCDKTRNTISLLRWVDNIYLLGLTAYKW